MHLWFAKKTAETRPEMIKSEGPYKGQRKQSENKDNELRKRLANQLYRHLGQIEDIQTVEIDTQMTELFKNVKQRE